MGVRRPDAAASATEALELSRVQLHLRLLFLVAGILLVLQSLLDPAWGHAETVERRFLRSSSAMSGKRVHTVRKGPFEQTSMDEPYAVWGGAGTAANGSACQRLLWLTGLATTNSSSEKQQQLQAALLSARKHTPSLQPVLVYSGEPSPLTAWFERNGGHAVHHRLSFLDDFEREPDAELRKALLQKQGQYLRLDTPLILDNIIRHGAVDLSNTSTSYVLYTDADVLFGVGGPAGSPRTDLSTCSVPAPRLVMLGREKATGAPWDTGVLLINVPGLRRELPTLLQYGREARFDFPGWEQGLINAYLREHTPALEVLPNSLSWKAYWGSSPSPSLLHWLGPKPAHASCMRCYLAHRGKTYAWSKHCPCSWVAYKSVFQRCPDHGRMYARALAAFEGYMKGVVDLGSATKAARNTQ